MKGRTTIERCTACAGFTRWSLRRNQPLAATRRRSAAIAAASGAEAKRRLETSDFAGLADIAVSRGFAWAAWPTSSE